MRQEEKQLLLVDLCARLPYGVIVNPIDCGKAKLIGFKDNHPILFDLVHQKEYDKPWNIEYIKPYLRPMLSMAEEERQEYGLVLCDELSINQFDWLNCKMFDYRGLIPKGLALEAPEGMYNI